MSVKRPNSLVIKNFELFFAQFKNIELYMFLYSKLTKNKLPFWNTAAAKVALGWRVQMWRTHYPNC